MEPILSTLSTMLENKCILENRFYVSRRTFLEEKILERIALRTFSDFERNVLAELLELHFTCARESFGLKIKFSQTKTCSLLVVKSQKERPHTEGMIFFS